MARASDNAPRRLSLSRSLLLLSVACLLVSGCVPSPPALDHSAVLRLDQQMAAKGLPEGSGPYSAYTRFYWLMNGPQDMARSCSSDLTIPAHASFPLIRADFLLSGLTKLQADKYSVRFEPPGIRFGKPTFGLCDGGCSEIDFLFDPRTSKILDMQCNGPA